VIMRVRRDRIVSRIRWSGALAAVAALAALLAIGPPGSARAATGTGYDQITGAGLTSSAVTVPWTQGLLDNTNQPITGANAIRTSPSGPLAFMYRDPDFQNLQVTVSQTQDITHQGLTVTWSGALQTQDDNARPASDFLQLMECYGDSSSGPSPQDCEFGSQILGSAANAAVDTRSGDLCAVDSSGNTLPPDTGNPPSSLDGSTSVRGCDPEEPVQGASASDIYTPDPQQYTIPFVPVPPTSGTPNPPAYIASDISQYFDEFSTNEIPEAVTSPGGTGQVQFETMTTTQAPGLGCGQQESNGQTRNCWLVIVPRGTFEPNGFQTSGLTDSTTFLYSSPLSASNWAMRIQVHLAYAPVETFCPIGTQELETVGTQIAARAVQSWQLALNQAANCSRIYGYSAVPEATTTQQLANSGSGVGLAFTTIPIGSEAARIGGGGGTANLPPILYAPVAVTAEGFGFNIDLGTSGYVSTPVKLTPELMAKALTQSYLTDLPDYYPPAGSQGPAWSATNSLNITKDQEFITLNPEVPQVGGGTGPTAPLITEDHSALNQQIWQWIQGDSATSAWLNTGTIDNTNAVTPDPAYMALQLGTAPAIDSFPRAYSACLDLGLSTTLPQKEELKCSLDLLPYVNNYDQAASDALTGNDPSAGGWDQLAVAPDGTAGWWDKTPPESVGSIFVWAISDTPDLAAYGLTDAQLCSDSGANCVGPTAASVTTAVDSATADSAGLLEVNPASPGAGGYPLTQVVYAAVPTNQPAANLSAYADLIAYAAGTGQTPGVAPGDLPPGYLPLPANLQTQAAAVVSQLRAAASPSTSASATASASTGTSNPGGNGTGASSPTPSGGPLSSISPSAGPSIKPPTAELAAQTTQRQPVGAVRWLLLSVVLGGAACAAGGTVLRSESVARWLQRMRP